MLAGEAGLGFGRAPHAIHERFFALALIAASDPRPHSVSGKVETGSRGENASSQTTETGSHLLPDDMGHFALRGYCL
jgi:hypothetical protein